MPYPLRDIEAFNVYREYILNISQDKLKDLIGRQGSRSDTFTFTQSEMNNLEFKIESNYSLGIGMMTDFNKSLGPISLYCKIESLAPNHCRLIVKTRTRIEVIALSLLAVASYIIVPMAEDEAPFWVYFIFLGVILWFQMIYRWQEKGLLQELEKVVGKPIKKSKTHSNKV